MSQSPSSMVSALKAFYFDGGTGGNVRILVVLLSDHCRKNIHIANDVRQYDSDNFPSLVFDLKSAAFNNILSERQTHN